MKLIGICQDLSTGAQLQAGFKSALLYGDAGRLLNGALYSGWELEHWRQRVQDEATHAAVLAVLLQGTI